MLYEQDGPSPVWVTLSQLRRAVALAESVQERARDDAEARVTFRTTAGMRPLANAVIVEVDVYRGGGSDVFEEMLSENGDVMLSWSSDELK